MNLSKPAWMSFIRHTLTLLGGGFIASGNIEESMMMEVIGAVMTLVGFTWSLFRNEGPIRRTEK